MVDSDKLCYNTPMNTRTEQIFELNTGVIAVRGDAGIVLKGIV